MPTHRLHNPNKVEVHDCFMLTKNNSTQIRHLNMWKYGRCRRISYQGSTRKCGTDTEILQKEEQTGRAGCYLGVGEV